MTQFDDPLLRPLADRAPGFIEDDTLGVTPTAS